MADAASAESYWMSDSSLPDDHRSTENLPTETDILVVGGGYAAACFVTHLLAKAKGSVPSTLVLEARGLCSGATGRNGGHCKPDSHKSIAELAHRYGVEAAAEVAAFENANLKAVKKYIEDEKVDCNFVTTRAFDVQMTESIHKADLEGYRFLRKEGVPSSFDVSYNGSEHVTNVCGIKDARSCYSYEAAHLWPYKLVHHMFTRAVAQGVNLQTNTKVTDIAKQANSPQKWEVRTSRGVVRARKVVVMTNAYTSSILPEYKGVIIPYRAICARIMPEGNAPPLLNTYGIRFSSWDHDYLVPRPDGSIIVGGARSEFFKDLKQWYGRTDDNLLIEPARHYFDDYMQRHFKGWESVTTKVTHLWTGIMGYSADHLPHIGGVPGKRGLYIMAGFTGHGMAQIFSCADAFSSVVLDRCTYRASGLPRLFEETEARLHPQENLVKRSHDRAIRASKL